MSERLRQFVLDVSNDLDRAKRLTADPTAELEQSDLSPEEKQIILSRDPDAVRLAMGADSSDVLAMNSFFKKPPVKPGGPAKPSKPRPRKKRAPARKAPAKKRTTRATPTRAGRKTARKAARKSARKGSRPRRR